MNYCCDRFKKESGEVKAMAGGGFLYPSGMKSNPQFEPDENGTWNINGCCGGGCYVVTDVKFCPFCGVSLITLV